MRAPSRSVKVTVMVSPTCRSGSCDVSDSSARNPSVGRDTGSPDVVMNPCIWVSGVSPVRTVAYRSEPWVTDTLAKVARSTEVTPGTWRPG